MRVLSAQATQLHRQSGAHRTEAIAVQIAARSVFQFDVRAAGRLVQHGRRNDAGLLRCRRARSKRRKHRTQEATRTIFLTGGCFWGV
jgi:hypothetical protein